MTFSSLSSDRFTVGQPDRIEGPRIQRTNSLSPVIHMTGGGNGAVYGMGEMVNILTALKDAGYTFFQPDVPWLIGNDTSLTRMEDAVAAAVARGFTGPPIMVGSSNGATCAFRYAAAHPVAAVVATLPTTAMAYIYQNDYASLRVRIETAWGITYPTALPTNANPLALAQSGAFAGVPMQLWYASDDPISLGTGGDVASFLAAVPTATATSVGALGHTSTAVLAVPAATVVQFVKSHTH